MNKKSADLNIKILIVFKLLISFLLLYLGDIVLAVTILVVALLSVFWLFFLEHLQHISNTILRAYFHLGVGIVMLIGTLVLFLVSDNLNYLKFYVKFAASLLFVLFGLIGLYFGQKNKNIL